MQFNKERELFEQLFSNIGYRVSAEDQHSVDMVSENGWVVRFIESPIEYNFAFFLAPLESYDGISKALGEHFDVTTLMRTEGIGYPYTIEGTIQYLIKNIDKIIHSKEKYKRNTTN